MKTKTTTKYKDSHVPFTKAEIKLRDYFAAKCISMFHSSFDLKSFDREGEGYNHDYVEKYSKLFARCAYQMADALLEERKWRKQ